MKIADLSDYVAHLAELGLAPASVSRHIVTVKVFSTPAPTLKPPMIPPPDTSTSRV